MEKRIDKACRLYCLRHDFDEDSDVFYLKRQYAKLKLETDPLLAKKIQNIEDPARVYDLLYTDLYKYDKRLIEMRENLIRQTEESTAAVKWESDRKCPFCKQKKYTIRQVVTRCIDEGTTLKANCICGQTFIL